jgi:hypothetical protein
MFFFFVISWSIFIVFRSFLGHFSANFGHFCVILLLFRRLFCHMYFFFLNPQVPGAVTALFARLADSLAHRSRLDKEDRALELALTLVRNLLRVPDGPGCVAVAVAGSGCLDVAVWQCGSGCDSGCCLAVDVTVAAVWLWPCGCLTAVWQWLAGLTPLQDTRKTQNPHKRHF